jgi:hypothetical protein
MILVVSRGLKTMEGIKEDHIIPKFFDRIVLDLAQEIRGGIM